MRLDMVATEGTRFTYVYDFGDWWEHEMLVERVVDGRSGRAVPGLRRG